MQKQKNPVSDRSAPSFWSLLVGPAVFVIWVVLDFQGEVRGASPLLQMLLLAPVALAAWAMYSLRFFFRTVADEYHLIVASALLSSAFMAICGLGVVPVEEIYIIIDGYDSRRIYADDSGMGYASGPKVVLGLVGAGLLFGLIFGFMWGVIVGTIRKIPFLNRPARSA